MVIKIYDGEFQIYDVLGLNVYVLITKSKDNVDVYINYPHYMHMKPVFSVSYEEFDIDDIVCRITDEFPRFMKDYFTEVQKLRTNLEDYYES